MDATTLEHRHLRSALEFAVLMVNEGRKRRPPIPYPSGMKKYLSMQRLPTAALGPLRRVIEADDGFRELLGVGAVPELVDPIGRLWLTRPDGWEAQVAELVTAAEDAERDADAAAVARRERKRREAAEHAAARSRVEVAALESQLDDSRARLENVRAELAEALGANADLRAEVATWRTETRHANDRLRAAERRIEQLTAQLGEAEDRRSDAESARDEVLADRVHAAVEESRLAELAALAHDLSARLAAESERITAADAGTARQRRRPLALPGGVLGDSEAATEHLLRSGASVLIDGYNVAMLGWPGLGLADQRDALLDVAENLARRAGVDLTVVFDGADVPGAFTDRRRLVRVVFSPEGVTADDVIRAEVQRLPPSRAVVVVTDDAEIVRDVRAEGANTVASGRFLATARR